MSAVVRRIGQVKMRLYIVRHSDAEDLDAVKYPDDELRPLIRKGKKKAQKVARWFKRQYGVPDRLLVSPALRTLETASAFQKEFGAVPDSLVVVDVLRPSGGQSQVIAELVNYASAEQVMLFGHEPNLSQLISTLLSGEPDVSIHMKKAGICCLSIDSLAEGKCATLEWLLDPAMLPDGEKGAG